ncbi:MAG TPA: adenylate/guanylate cyclase domain-containing protein [Novosphingobium sp.]|nr:adenylate/guanylate cyclase domain-containing protein [Novosphingobium sp.]
MLAAIAALEKQRGLLGAAVVDPAIAELKRQLEDATPGSLTTQGERKLVTVMFADTSGFTAMSEARDAEYVRNLMNDCFEQLVPVVEAHGGTIDKFIGDAIMALFGAPIAREDDATRALNAALAMLEKLDAFNRANGVEVGLHFGINTGEVIAGEIGSAGRRDYSVIGDAVNVAARLQDLSKRGEIFVGPETHRLARNEFDFEALDAIPLKGREAAVPIFRLIGHKSPTYLSPNASSFDTPMVGRETELRVLVEAASKLCAGGAGSAILIAGDAGVGKSRLIGETRLTVEPDLFWVQGRAQSYAQNASYATERTILLHLIGATIDTDPADLARMLLDECRARIADLAEETYAHLAAIVGLVPDEIALRFTQSVSAEALKPRIAQAFLRFVKASRGGKPLALCFEDVHWLDPVSVQLIRHLIDAAAAQGVLLILTSRSEALSELGLDRGDLPLQTLRLNPLDTSTSANLMRNFLKCETLPPESLEFLHERSEGNPFFLEELLRSLVETGALAVEDGRLVSQPTMSATAIPTTLQGIIMARVDRLPGGSKSTLQTASVIGRSFLLRLLAFVHEGGQVQPAKLHDQLMLLEDREFVHKNTAYQLDQADSAYVFHHAVTQEVVYGSLLEKRRAQIHRAIAETIESYFGDRSEEFAPALALHFRHAGEPRKAAQYYLLAARRASVVFAYEEARNCYVNALEQLGACDHGEVADEDCCAMAEAHIGQADILRQNGDHAAARAQYETALSLLGTHDAILRASVHRKYGMSLTSQRLSAEALESAVKANAALDETPIELRTAAWWDERIEFQIERLWACYWAGDAELLRKFADAARPEIDEHASAAQKSRYFNGVVLIAFREENLDISDATLACAHYATDLARRSGDPGVLTRAYFLVACCHMWRADLDSAEADFKFVLEQLDHTGDTEWRVMTDNYLGLIQRKRGDLEGARYWAELTLVGADKARMPLYAMLARANLAWLAGREGRLEEAERLAAETFAALKPLPFQVKWLAAWPLIACHHAREAIDQAGDAIRVMLDPQQQPQPAELTEALQGALAALESGDALAAQAKLSAAVPMARALGYI